MTYVTAMVGMKVRRLSVGTLVMPNNPDVVGLIESGIEDHLKHRPVANLRPILQVHTEVDGPSCRRVEIRGQVLTSTGSAPRNEVSVPTVNRHVGPAGLRQGRRKVLKASRAGASKVRDSARRTWLPSHMLGAQPKWIMEI